MTEQVDPERLPDTSERQRRWRLAVGTDDGTPPQGNRQPGWDLGPADVELDRALAELYEADPADRRGGLGSSAPRVSRWLGDIRRYFPGTVVEVMQRDAIDRLGLAQLLLEPEVLSRLEPNVSLVTTLIDLQKLLPEESRSTARQVVATVVAEIEKRIGEKSRTSVRGALNRAVRTRRPRPADIDWHSTIRANLRHWLPEHRTVVPHTLVGHGRGSQAVQREIVLAIDQSGSMGSSVVYSSVYGSVLASMAALKTSLVVFDTEVVDLTDLLHDPVEVIFSTQLGGGTDINRAVAYCQTLITRPADSIFVLISDLFEGGIADELVRRMHQLVSDGVQVIVLLALSDDGAPAYDHHHAEALAAIGIPAFACTPDAFPDLLATAINRGDLAGWAERFHDSRR